jgi:hypothetical protein
MTEDPLQSYLEDYPWMAEMKRKQTEEIFDRNKSLTTQRGMYKGRLAPAAQWVM